MKDDDERKTEEPKMVSVSEDYLAFLHDELSENQARLAQLVGDSGSKAMLCYFSDRLVTTIEPGRYAFDPLEGIVHKLDGWGMGVSIRKKGNTVEISVKCPIAGKVHPRMASKEPRCPLGEYILGAVRLEASKSQLRHNSLTKDGVELVIDRSNV